MERNESAVRPTPLLDLGLLARRCDVGRVLAKAENERELGNFKSLGGINASLRAMDRHLRAHGRSGDASPPPTLLCASDGNHGLAVATAALRLRAPARIYLPASVQGWRVARIAQTGAAIVRVDGSYDDAVSEARHAAAGGEGLLIPDTTDDPHDPVVGDVTAGYLQVAREVARQIADRAVPTPTHVFVQAGVGGFAAAMAQGLCGQGDRQARLITVEPESAACVAAALDKGQPVQVPGTLATCADMLSCGVASAPALATLIAHDAKAMTVNEEELLRSPRTLHLAGGPRSSPSGAAGVAGLLKACSIGEIRRAFGLDRTSTVLVFITEGADPRES